MKSILKAQSITLILLLLCSVCVVPVIASQQRNPVTEDGVHLVKFDDSPTILDSQYYHMEQNMDFVVDGNQFYWVRIGNTVSKSLTTVWWATLVAFLLLLIVGGSLAYGCYLLLRRLFPEHLRIASLPRTHENQWRCAKSLMVFALPIMFIIGFTCANGVVVNKVADGVTHIACDGFVDAKASDGTILLQVDKIHPKTNQLYMKSGVNLTALTHLSGSGNILTATGVKPI